ncbi:hypothetical protein RX909_28660, partial [Pseudomonas syringae pv. actinidiae]|nr:hypothetical protein [Pseudomonas syringae pv. actinidiae]
MKNLPASRKALECAIDRKRIRAKTGRQNTDSKQKPTVFSGISDEIPQPTRKTASVSGGCLHRPKKLLLTGDDSRKPRHARVSYVHGSHWQAL